MEAIQKKLEGERSLLEQNKQHERDQSIARLLTDEQTQLTVQYIQLQLDSLTFAEISAHSASEISKLIFDAQLKLIEAEFRTLPDGLCSLQEFVVMMLRVLKFPLEVAPQAAIGLREMFATVAAGRKLIDYGSLFKYVVGQVVSVKDQVNNTEFQMQFHENKLQDFLFHDKGIKRVFHHKELHITICLDRESNQVKFYDREMKLVGRYLASKDKHEGRNPGILEASYCEIYFRLGLIHDDQTITVMNCKPFLDGDSEFFLNSVNEICQHTPKQMRSIYYLEMWGKWLLAAAEDNSLYRFDPEKQKAEEQLEEVNIGVVDFNLHDVLQLTSLSTVCLISGNQVYFCNENLSKRLFVFSHGCNIRTLRYSEPEGKFYLAGKENIITVFERNKLEQDFKVRTIELGRYRVSSFQVFPQHGVLVMTDDSCEVKLLQYGKGVVTQEQSFKHIRKSSEEMLMCRFNRHEFCLFETYMVVFNIDKMAIESEVETRFSPYFHYNAERELFYCSVNHQIVSVHLLRGEVEDVYTEDNSNIAKHRCFFLSERAHIFEINDQCYLFELYFNDERLEGQNRNYKRKVALDKLQGALYDAEHALVLAWSDTKLLQVRNEGNNNFAVVNSLQFHNGEKVRDVHFNHGLITVLTTEAVVHDFNFYDMTALESRQFRLEATKTEDEPEIVQYVRTDVQKAEVLLLSNNVLLVYSEAKMYRFQIEELLPKSKIVYSFVRMRYQELLTRKKLKGEPSTEVYDDPAKDKYLEEVVKTVFLLDSSGHVVWLDLTNLLKAVDLEARLALLHRINDSGINGFMKGGQILEIRLPTKLVDISKLAVDTATKPKSVKIWRPHERQVVQIVGIHFEQLCLISYANDGYFKLWNDRCECLFALRMPSFNRELWNMAEIEKQKCTSNIDRIQRLVRDYQRRIKQISDSQTVHMLLQKGKDFKRGNELDRPNVLEPFTIEIDNRQIEDLMNRTQVVFNRRFSLQEKRSRREELSTTAYKPSELSPWKKNTKFVQMVDAVDRKHRDRIPQELNKLRASLDVHKPNYDSPTKSVRIPFLPQLDQYTPEPKPVEEVTEMPAIDAKDREQDMKDPVRYLKNKRIPPRINKFDEIDKEFERKRMQQFKNVKKNAVIKVAKKEEVRSQRDHKQQVKLEVMDQIRLIFEEHNKEVLRTKVGRVKDVPRVHHRMQDLN